MSRPTDKSSLLKSAYDNYDKLLTTINSLTDEEQIAKFPFDDRDKNIRDILIHLYEWHILLLNWVRSNQKGKTQPFLPKPYNWKTYPEMNIEFWVKHQNTAYEDARKMLHNSHKEVMILIEEYSDEELFTKKFFPWTGTTSLGAYAVSATSSHYDWAMKKIRKYKKLI